VQGLIGIPAAFKTFGSALDSRALRSLRSVGNDNALMFDDGITQPEPMGAFADTDARHWPRLKKAWGKDVRDRRGPSGLGSKN
jgi:hypothetical protein